MSLRTLERAAQAQAPAGDATRPWLVGRLGVGQVQSVPQLTAGSQLGRQAISQHLQVLQQAELAGQQRAGRESRYALAPQPIADARQFLYRVWAQWGAALARRRVLLET